MAMTKNERIAVGVVGVIAVAGIVYYFYQTAISEWYHLYIIGDAEKITTDVCEENADCKSGLECKNGQCVSMT